MKKQQKTQTQTGSSINSPKFHMHEVLVRFSPSLTRMQQQRLLTESVIEILSDPMFFIRDNYYDQNWKQILPYIQQSYCRRFFLMGIGERSILREISLIKFSCLKQIDLSSNKIDNLELISMIKLPYVKSIVLRNNHITSINSLRKGKWKDIEQIDLEGNHFIEWGRISELYTCPSNIESFDLKFFSVHSITTIQDVAPLYAKYMTGNESQQISRILQIFNQQNQQEINFTTLNQQNHIEILHLGKKRFQTLKRKFEKKARQ